jgi:DNA-binding transcriptional regulator YiaG
MRAANVGVVHAREDEASEPISERCTSVIPRRELDRGRLIYGRHLRCAREAAEVSGRGAARAAGVAETTLRRWEAGEVSAPLDVLDRLPPTVALRLVQLVETSVRGRQIQRVSDADYLRALTESYANVINARCGQGSEDVALLELSDVARAAAGGRRYLAR